ncbi:MAG: hypothetical protein JSU91_07960 [Thermoplasmatales archaeon]|nr:MAG: hypothetical protein JSU91_07960 [Thermoplasmatales archaeon]
MKRLIGLIICTLLLCSMSGLAYNITTEEDKTTINDDVPIWEFADSWRYDIGRLFLQLNQSGQFIKLDLSLDNLLTNVVGVTSTSYEMSISGNIAGIFDYDDGSGTTLGGILFMTRVSGDLQIRQSDLAAEEAIIVIKSIALLLEHPLPLPIPIPVPLTITITIIQETPRPLIDFPLFDGKIGIIPETDLITSIKVESIALKILHIFIPDIPEEIIIEQNVTLPMLLYSATQEEITVSGVNYTAYNINFYEGLLGSIYYAPTAGNYIKALADISTPEIIFSVNGELTETTYK